jgi:hypothetical protein
MIANDRELQTKLERIVWFRSKSPISAGPRPIP